METKTEKYNGWENYETWAVALWIDNEETSQLYVGGELARDHKGDVNGFAEAIKNYIEENAPKTEGLYADLLNAAISEVDWLEIAQHFAEVVS